ncbi:MAG: tRNA (N6-isopentenyl adenosine(37)-C2)-methylthiotransferase MiaB [Synergistetes bacterium]|nr:tRNA (N6-isopentenyl adenosine(37)-C2)-methylthiotransferase MiaB [Synergistota bacterium]MDW8192843.1 tRNA (N6-isopentenyl adenosine(37)-C2)-methylthiotransferase MiaB [Synergistota bacterium]
MRFESFHVITYGCQMNMADSERIRGVLLQHGLKEKDSEEDVDFLVLNTCVVRDKSEKKVYGKLGKIKVLWERNKRPLVAVCGCMAQKEGKKLLDRFPFVVLVMGPSSLARLPEALLKIEKGERLLFLDDEKLMDIEKLPASRCSPFKAWIPITYGCNRFCTYCIVPFTRGPERSRHPESVLKEIEELASKGYKEITLLGQSVDSYGKDLPFKYTLADLLRDIEKVDGIKWVRFTTSHPLDFSDELIKAIEDCSKVCEHFHIPVQSGSTKILARMGRGYTREDYLRLIERLKSKFPQPEASYTTDIIVGFPGETEEDFMDSMRLVEEVRFDMVYTAIYSPRPGTLAATFPDQVPEDIKSKRINKLNELVASVAKEIHKELEGRTYEVLVDGFAPKDDMLQGRTRANRIVVFKGEESLIGSFVKVKIVKGETWALLGELVSP